MGVTEQKIKLLKIVADADEILVDAMLKEIIAYYTVHPEQIPDALLQTWSGSTGSFSEVKRKQIWEETKRRLEVT
jgi:hypothetical protein